MSFSFCDVLTVLCLFSRDFSLVSMEISQVHFHGFTPTQCCYRENALISNSSITFIRFYDVFFFFAEDHEGAIPFLFRK